MTLAYGLDLAGYSTGKSGVAYASRRHPDLIEVTVIRKHAFNQKLDGAQPLAEIAEQQTVRLRAWGESGVIMVDIPIDIEPLPRPRNPKFIWELTLRPVDYAFGAFPALADRIGSPFARFQHLLTQLPRDWVGTRIFETYPAVSLKQMGLHEMGYKGQSAEYSDGKWGGVTLAGILNRMGVSAQDGMQINDDEFDAMICALAGVATEDERLAGDALNNGVDARIRQKLKDAPEAPYTAPPSFALMRTLPKARITLTAQESDSGMLY